MQADDKVLLTVLNEEDEVLAEFTLADLEAMPSTQVETTTNWTEGMQDFTGVPLASLIADIAPEASAVDATAINDYAVQIPADGWDEEFPIIAYKNHGKPMSVRAKGPLWVIYPFDSGAAYRSDVVYSRSIWQLDRLKVID
ncbi:oxidoreductase [Pseudooceanicola antarcticus]|uniref:Oxidoreductase n=1 Tax=Pseudooceanicola antarcticus TaxID=1247613 RepID=A0ABX4MPD1_9RHOB|nr:oxidoreductase [Pseudooceanicola antarcticus]